MDAEPDRFQENGADRSQAFEERGRCCGRVLACTGATQALSLLDVGQTRGAQVAGGAADAVRGGVPQPNGFEELRADFRQVGTEGGFRA
nr:hypothetical protein OG296_42945 [Streptomyces sp. NBC_01001]